MSIQTDRNYIEALEYCSLFHNEPQGVTKLDSPKSTEAVLIKQNNLIITLLISLHKKLDALEKREKVSLTSDIETDLKNITGRLNNLSFKDTGKEKITRRLPRNLKFPV